MILAIQHVQITVNPGDEQRARVFYLDVLRLQEIPKPEILKANGGFWAAAPNLQFHIGIEAGVSRDQTKAHVAFVVDDIESCRRKLAENGVSAIASTQIPGFNRFECRDPFGNRLEFMQVVQLIPEPDKMLMDYECH